MNILVVGNYYYPEHRGGIETVSNYLVKYYKDFGNEVRWVAADVPPTFRTLRDGDIPIRAWNFAEENLGFPHPIPFPSEFLKLYTSIKWADVIHLQDCLYPINILSFIVAKLFKKPILLTQYAKFIPYRQLYKRLLQLIGYQTIGWVMFTLVDKVTFITSNVRDNMQHINPVKMQTIVSLGVDTDFYKPIDSNKRTLLRKKLYGNISRPIILFVGRMVERKGVHLIRPLIKKYNNWIWVLVGRPDDYNPNEWEEENLIYIQNATDKELHELYSLADLLVHPSVGEGFTLIASESLACGTPIVISDESLYEIDENNWGLFYPTKPETMAIESTIKKALNNIEHLEKLRLDVRQFALNRLSWEIMVRQYITLLNEIIRKREHS